MPPRTEQSPTPGRIDVEPPKPVAMPDAASSPNGMFDSGNLPGALEAVANLNAESAAANASSGNEAFAPEVRPATFPSNTMPEAADALNAESRAAASSDGKDAFPPEPEDGRNPRADVDPAMASAESATAARSNGNEAFPPNAPETSAASTGNKPETAPPAAVTGEVITPEQQQQERADLSQKVRDGNASQEDFARLNEINRTQSAETRRQELTDRLANGEALKDDEFAELNTLRNETATTPEQALSPEQQLNQEIEGMGSQLLMDMAKEVKTPEESMALRENVKAFKQKWAEKQLLNSGFTEEQSQAAMKAAMNVEVAKGGNKEIALEQEVIKKMQEMRAIEMRLMVIPETVDGLKKQHTKVKNSIRKLGPPGINDGPTTISARQENYARMSQLARIKSQLVNVKNEEGLLQSQHIDSMQYVRRKLGVTSGAEALGEWMGAKINVISTQGMRLSSESFMTLDDVA